MTVEYVIVFDLGPFVSLLPKWSKSQRNRHIQYEETITVCHYHSHSRQRRHLHSI